jgi:prepilin-type N-terminal cleavage/methylation domain-containing protein
MTTHTHRQDRGVTLLELLVVLMILSIVLTAAVRTWDVTLERGRAQTTAQKLDQLVKVIVGDPDYIVAGARADFGFVGDEGRLPKTLQELVVRPDNDSVWRGPYIRSTFSQSADGYRTDGWGDTIYYGYEVTHGNPDSLWVRSYGGRGAGDRSRWQTLNFPYTFKALTQNDVGGHMLDVRGNEPPPTIYDKLEIRLYYPKDGHIYAWPQFEGAAANFSYAGIPQGTCRLVALYHYGLPGPEVDSVVKDVPVYPGVGAPPIYIRLPRAW